MLHEIALDWNGSSNSLLQEEAKYIAAALQDLKHFEPLYKRYYSNIYSFVNKRIDDSDNVKDITSLVFEKAMINLHQFKPQGYSFGSWLYRIASSECANFYRKSGKVIKVSIDSDQLIQLSADIEEATYDNFDKKRLLKALQGLNNMEMELLLLRYVEKMHYTELSTVFNTSENSLRVKMHRILDRLKSEFGKK
jgi:RNA polymerase sigma-70 factor (ECF subfamily)